MCFHIGRNRDLTISLHCTILRTVCVVWVLSHVTEQLCSWQQQSPAVGEAHSSFLKATLLSAKSRKLCGHCSVKGRTVHFKDKRVFSQQLGFPAVFLGFTSKQTHKWHFVPEGTWSVRCCGRDQNPLCVSCIWSLCSHFLLLLQSQLGLDYLNRRDEVFSIMTDWWAGIEWAGSRWQHFGSVLWIWKWAWSGFQGFLNIGWMLFLCFHE